MPPRSLLQLLDHATRLQICRTSRMMHLIHAIRLLCSVMAMRKGCQAAGRELPDPRHDEVDLMTSALVR
jgi:hypothetical protein